MLKENQRIYNQALQKLEKNRLKLKENIKKSKEKKENVKSKRNL